MTSLNLILFVILIVLTAFFVATEFSIVKVRSTKIDQLVAEGNKRAIAAKHVTSHLDEYLSACQLGITVTALGLGWIGEPTFEVILSPLFDWIGVPEASRHILIVAVAFLIVTFIHVVVGELAPKTVAIQKAEAVALWCAKPIIWFYRLLYPFIWVLNGAARILVGLFGLKPASEHEMAHSEEELRQLMTESFNSGEINKNEFKYVNNIFEFDERVAKEIMVPRTEITSISIHDSIDKVLNIIKNGRYTRYPVTNEDKDHIIGFLNVKEFLTNRMDIQDDAIDINDFVNPIIHVIETIHIHDLLVKMQKERIHIAILFDEYGGTSGLVTVEDILEEIVGEIRDEFDEDEISDVRQISDGHFIVNGKLLLADINTLLDTTIEHEEVDTIGGWFLTNKLDPTVGSTIEFAGYSFIVHESNGRQIQYIEIKSVTPQTEPLKEDEDDCK
ncbi:membrane protein [Alkalihalobacillus alcalophilus ATCC 27647 = CGMCC 1.3604]|uniref:Membrane protein n=1 Tax=Alkalihalobacillus alcalophilus ATCC 27647 = CGMCC 1.3604 TaxID=1218173 RepID=A0A094WPN4_ALKAL|nr:hemolysin family protein [Alkalihalobacillus alcalophilus]KGA97993.1 membrane protein [Alkalihalobacillus alcalophilus ATCC 27647 = CGMCC 1.3604]MED1561887.1 hemolysin family protein [Alkalihalobacillus alcalophilus]THG90440.1 membrane protein [Alkalihalobacillus alcalophilus ATCC 27647 = CGMCC 1.3604]